MKVAVVSVGIGGWYSEGVARLMASVANHAPHCLVHEWHGVAPDGIPWTPASKEYKLNALDHAIEDGADIVFWMDASVWLVAPLDPIVEYVQEHGVALWNIPGRMLSENAMPEELQALGIGPREAWAMPYVGGGVIGLARHAPRSRRFLAYWRSLASDGTQRWGHDQPTISKVAWDLALPTITNKWWHYANDEEPPADTVLLARGM